MNKINIKYIFSAGFRCYSPDILKKFNLRPFSGPFDYLFIDLETVFKLINVNMKGFLTNIVNFNKQKGQKYAIDSMNELNKEDIYYMAHNYNSVDLRINTNFLDNILSNNIYDWKKICIFVHHNVCNKEECEIIEKRVERFNIIIINQSDNTCLFHITRILTIDDIEEYINSIIHLKNTYSISTYIVIIVCCDNLADTYYFKSNILFIIKRVDPYIVQLREGQTDNNFGYEAEIDMMKSIFNFQLEPSI